VRQWYKQHYAATHHRDLDKDRFGGYLARKQTHIHKLAMILAAAESDTLVLTAEHLAIANHDGHRPRTGYAIRVFEDRKD
jgi:hypothetical protein